MHGWLVKFVGRVKIYGAGRTCQRLTVLFHVHGYVSTTNKKMRIVFYTYMVLLCTHPLRSTTFVATPIPGGERNRHLIGLPDDSIQFDDGPNLPVQFLPCFLPFSFSLLHRLLSHFSFPPIRSTIDS